MSNVENLPRYVDKEEKNGCVARNLREMLEACNLSFLFSLDSHSKQAGDECHLLHAVSFFYATYLTLPKHVHRFISLQCSPRSLERKEAHPKLYQPFQEAMILFDEVVEIFALSQFTRLWHDPFRFQLLESFGIGRVFINCDDVRSAGMRCSKRFREETFGCLSISGGTEQKFQSVSMRIDSAIQVHPDLFHFDIGLINAPRVIRRIEMRSAALF